MIVLQKQEATKMNYCNNAEKFFLNCIFPGFSRIRTEYGEIIRISLYLVRMRENPGKIRTRITPNKNSFYTVFLSAFQNCILPSKVHNLILPIYAYFNG